MPIRWRGPPPARCTAPRMRSSRSSPSPRRRVTKQSKPPSSRTARSTSPWSRSRSSSATMVEHVLARRHVVLRVDAEDAVRLGRPRHLADFEVAVERADLPEPLRLGQPLLGAAALGDVLARAVEAAGSPVRAQRGAAPAQQQPVATVGMAHPQLELHRPAALHRRPRRLGDHLAVVGMDEVEGVVTERRVLRDEPEHAPELGRPLDLVRVRIPVPRADAGDLLRLGQPRLAALVLGDVGRETDHRERPPVSVEDGCLLRQVGPLSPSVFHFERPAGRQHLAVLNRPALDRGRIEELLRHPADDLVRRPAHELAGRVVGVGDPAVRVLDVEQHRHPVEDLDQAGSIHRGASVRIHSGATLSECPLTDSQIREGSRRRAVRAAGG